MINLLVAMPSEAKPLLDQLRLPLLRQRGQMRHYGNQQYNLVISGMGKTAMACGCGWLAGLAGSTSQVWLNTGIAGHQSRAVGTLLVADRITDQCSQRSWYPPQLLGNLESDHLITVDAPETGYPQQSLYDMEAAAFVEAARQFATAELVQSLKVVSDNAQHSIEKLNKTVIADLMHDAVESVLRFASDLDHQNDALSSEDDDPQLNRMLASFESRWHLSATRRLQARRLLQRYSVLAKDGLDCAALRQLASCTNAAELIARLTHAVDALPVEFGE